MPVALQSLRTVPAPTPQNRMGAKIANSKGVPGTLGCVARTLHDGQLVLLSNAHVLFGSGRLASDAIWHVYESDGTRRCVRAGAALYGKTGIVCVDGNEYHVDCAVGTVADQVLPVMVGHDVPRLGDRVTKLGAETGSTTGVVVDVSYCPSVLANGRMRPAPRQLLIRSIEPGVVFSAEGDSGAVVFNQFNKAVGLLWGATGRGDGVACHMHAVLHTLNIRLLAGAAA